jgi:uncharacterized caspase-like protein
LVVLDACRNNPFSAKMERSFRTRSVDRGLARIEPNGSVLVAYAAKDGTTAADGSGRNSPFTAALLNHLESPGLEVNFLFRNVRDDVLSSTKGAQEPFVYGSLSREAIYFKDPIPGEAAPSLPAFSLPQSGPSPDEVAWSLMQDTKDAEQLRRFINHFPDSPHRREAEAAIEALSVSKPAPKAATAPKPVAEQKFVPARKPSNGNCFMFNGEQICD